jgi:hypothetical protein
MKTRTTILSPFKNDVVVMEKYITELGFTREEEEVRMKKKVVGLSLF